MMRALSGRIPAAQLAGPGVAWGGLDAAAPERAGISLARLAFFADQLDVHLPLLTVRETARFAWASLTVEPALCGGGAAGAAAVGARPDRVVECLSLAGCADTRVGDALTRGISGGERKRLTIAEALVSNARVLCLDEISTGLDASVTFDIVRATRVGLP